VLVQRAEAAFHQGLHVHACGAEVVRVIDVDAPHAVLPGQVARQVGGFHGRGRAQTAFRVHGGDGPARFPLYFGNGLDIDRADPRSLDQLGQPRPSRHPVAGDPAHVRRHEDFRGGAGPVFRCAERPDDFPRESGQGDMRYAQDIGHVPEL
jgi:hypothetical protein